MKLEEQRDRINPKEGGVKVFMEQLPEITVTEKNNKTVLLFVFVDGTDSEFRKMLNDPFEASPGAKKIIMKQLLNFYHAYMTEENYEKFKGTDFESFENIVEVGNSLVAEDWDEVEATLLLGYNKDNYTDIPAFDPFISTKYLEKDLVLKASSGLSYVQKEKDNSIPGMVADEEEGMIVA